MGVIVAKELLKLGIKLGISWAALRYIRKKFIKEFGFDPGEILKDSIKMTNDIANAMKQETAETPTAIKVDKTGKMIEIT